MPNRQLSAAGSGLVENPFIKKRNLDWTINLPAQDESEDAVQQEDQTPSSSLAPPTAAVEAGYAHVEDHLAYFTQILQKGTQSPYPSNSPHLTVDEYRELYNANSGNRNGSHFIIHQHDHPIAGTHYDLRLQINETSSASWAIMYGLPGDPNSVRLNRNATETRVHCLWNHLIETASSHTGFLLIWDTGTYSILPRRSKYAPAIDPDSERSSSSSSSSASSSDSEGGHTTHDKQGRPRRRHAPMTEQQKLHRAFANRKVRLQLHGTRLPRNYVLNLRLTRGEDVAGRQRSKRSAAGGPPRKKRRRGQAKTGKLKEPVMTSSDEDGSRENDDCIRVKDEDEDNDANEDVKAPVVQAGQQQEGISALEKELRELEDEEVRRTNAYMGAENTIGSVHQRRWYLSLDRVACGFTRRYRRRHEGLGKNGRKVEWVDQERADGTKQGGGDGRLKFPFYVRGVEVERSVITGRLGADILRDEGVVDYVNRQGWHPVLN
ncbi:DNA polymerase ligase-domain-containing protein [Microdochium bolleyi]|uniref:DNA polymerase ligase-domain-containing protein n=1 Tax=Microdochium bolleyi TaxID=196109 RepID=A0A136J1W8_9PEZI|nr:DNA polymerase ligase-domain-containing protein [Microdochium bolleyi]